MGERKYKGLFGTGLPDDALASHWHRPVWVGRPREKMTGMRFLKTLPGDMRRLLFGRPTPKR